jgi:hypothetical protein
MGLDAVVFRSISELERQFGADLFEVDENSGEAILKPDKRIRIPRTAFVAIERRIGNLSEVEHLRAILQQILPQHGSVIQERVLYSATHSGDSIEQNDLPRLHEEICFLKTQDLAELAAFIETMECLLLAAEAERNPIVFV